jgi:hypothetical protein
VEGSELRGINFGETKIIVTIKLGDDVLATKELQCKVNDNNAIYTNKTVYELYTMNKVLDSLFKTEELISTSMYVDGTRISNYGEITWISGDSSIVEINNKGKITAVGEGETYVVGNYRYGDIDISTRKIPVKVLKPYLDTKIDIVFDKNSNTGLFDAATVLGDGHSIGKVVDIQTNKEYNTNNNAIDLNNMSLGEYRFAIHEQDEKFTTEVNVVVADYIINDIEDLNTVEWYSCSYVALNTDLVDVGVYNPTVDSPDSKVVDNLPDFRGTFNGMGHKITGIRYRESCQGLFGTIRDVTIKNLAIQCTLSKEGQGALFYRSVNAVLENVYVESTFSNAYRCGGLCDVILGSLVIRNSIIKTFNGFKVGTLGALCARSQLMKVTYENTYFISPLKLCSEISNSSNKRFSYINSASAGVLFETEEEFMKAKDKGTISFDNYNHYWHLNSSIPIFASLK